MKFYRNKFVNIYSLEIAMQKPPLIYYHKICELFFAIAAVPETMDTKQYGEFRDKVLEEWQNLTAKNAVFQNDGIARLRIVLDWFDYINLDPYECFDNFSDYYQNNPQWFTPSRKELIWNMILKITSFFSSNKEAQTPLLSKLKITLDN